MNVHTEPGPAERWSHLGRIGFIGAGRVGRTLAAAFARAGAVVVAVHSRSEASAQALAAQVAAHAATAVRVCADPDDLVRVCDTVFITVNDDGLQALADGLAWRQGQCAVHCSGATEVAVLSAVERAGGVAAGFHPLHTFGDVSTALTGLPGCTVAVECASPAHAQALDALARAIGARPFSLPPGCRALYHASAHYAGSLVVTLMDEAVQHWARFGVGPEAALQALLPLLGSTVRAMAARGLGPGMAGVVARGDVGVLRAHLEAMAAVGPPALELYASLSRRSVALAEASGRIDAGQALVLRQALDSAQFGGHAH